MLKEGEILQAVRSILNSDSTLDTLLGVGDFDKVVIGVELPDTAGLPVINLVTLTETTIDLDTKMTEMLIGVIIRCHNIEYDRPDYDTFDGIADRVNALLDDQQLTLTNDQFCACYQEGTSPVSNDFDRGNAGIKQVRYRVFAL